jgi:hypothetical protein
MQLVNAIHGVRRTIGDILRATHNDTINTVGFWEAGAMHGGVPPSTKIQ